MDVEDSLKGRRDMSSTKWMRKGSMIDKGSALVTDPSAIGSKSRCSRRLSELKLVAGTSVVEGFTKKLQKGGK